MILHDNALCFQGQSGHRTLRKYQETAFGRKENSWWHNCASRNRHTRCCVILGSPRGELHPGGRLGRGSDRRDKQTKSDVQKLNKRVRQEEGRTPAGLVQQSHLSFIHPEFRSTSGWVRSLLTLFRWGRRNSLDQYALQAQPGGGATRARSYHFAVINSSISSPISVKRCAASSRL